MADRGTVTAAEFADLQTIAANLENGIVTSSYVESIFRQLVDGSAANAFWTGGGTSPAALGDLAAGTGSTQMNELIGKWFLGTDLPDPTAQGASTSSTITPTYQAYALPLFGGTGAPQISDVAQGDVGDCELCSGMIETLLNHPGLISSMFADDGNGVYGVRFYVNGKETWVTVNDQLPTYRGGLIFNNGFVADQQTGLWADLIEKAYAQLSSDGNIGHPNTNSYANISSDSAFNVLTNLTDASEVQYLFGSSSNWLSYKSIIVNAVEAHDDVMLETGTTVAGTTDASGKQMLVANHAYAVIGYDGTTGDFIVRNPWGVESGNQTYDTQFEVSMPVIASNAVQGNFAIDNSAAPNVVINFAAQVVSLAATTTPAFTQANSYLSAGASVPLSSLIQATDTAGLPVGEYMIQSVGSGSIALNGATDLATAAQQANGEIVVSAADLGKLTLSTGASPGTVELFVSGDDGAGWGLPIDVSWTVDASPLAVIPSIGTVTAPSSAVSVAGLFTLAGPQSGAAGLDYLVAIAAGGGTLNANGATDLLANGSGGRIEVSAADLAKITYTAPSAAGVAVLAITAIDSSQSSDTVQIPVDVGYSAAAALAAFDQGETPYQVAVTDSAADVFANLDRLEQMMPNWNLLAVRLTDATPQAETISLAQYDADQGALSIVSGDYSLTVTGATAAAAGSLLDGGQNHVTAVQITDGAAAVFSNLSGLETLAAAKEIAGITLTDASPAVESVSATQLTADASVLAEITGNYSLSVTDSAANVDAGLDALQSYAAAGRLTGITLTDGGTPVISVTASQYAADQTALHDIGGDFVLDVSAGPGQSVSGLAGHATVVTFGGDAGGYAFTAAGDGVGLTVTGSQGATRLSAVTALQFADHELFVASQTPATAGAVSSEQVAALYAAVFDRAPDVMGLNYYEMKAAANPGLPITSFADWFLASPEYTGNAAHDYAQTAAGDAQFITDIYENLLRRAPGGADVSWYQTNVIAPIVGGAAPGSAAYTAAEAQAHATVLADVSQSSEFLADVQVTSQHPADAQHWLVLI